MLSVSVLLNLLLNILNPLNINGELLTDLSFCGCFVTFKVNCSHGGALDLYGCGGGGVKLRVAFIP